MAKTKNEIVSRVEQGTMYWFYVTPEGLLDRGGLEVSWQIGSWDLWVYDPADGFAALPTKITTPLYLIEKSVESEADKKARAFLRAHS